MTDRYTLATMEVVFEADGGLSEQPQYKELSRDGWEVHVVKDSGRRDDGLLVLTLLMRRPLAHPARL